ncbi:uncharacterized protein LOC115564497 isoform X1 [Drosophila navojoa]|uniref:uncharacterized protein LOC115564497 isoform X1 n=1 Tax=Drosophila navojoa TaxID=7232 RepID=UPI0011BEB9FD|nr:uncharacterized protein LOC115564497 isoform X1 [Drosophila navojoa]
MTTSDEMGTFCHDHIQHPLMWCDDKKRLVERKNAEESLRMWRRRKAEENARKEKDKQEYYDLFLQHCPWGRPGGGAPNVEVRRKDITAVGLHSTPTVTTAHRINSLQPCRYNDYFTMQKKCHKNPLAVYHHHHHHPPGAGGRLSHAHSIHHLQESGPRSSTVTICERELPLKPGVSLGHNANGESIHIELKEHPSMSFRNKGHLDIELRYKPSPPCKGKPMLDKIVVNSESEHPLQEKLANQKKKLQAKLEKPPCKEPWGKAGPGGKPWRSPKQVGNTFMKSLGWTNKEMLKELDQDNPVTPAEKNTFRKSRGNKPPKPQRCCELCTCNCPAINSSNSPLKPSRKIPAPPACGLRSPAKECKPHKPCPQLPRGLCAGSTTNSTSLATPDPSAENAGGGVELVPLLARRRGLHRPISLSSTDVTKRTPSHDRYAPPKHKTKSNKAQSISNIIKNISHMKRHSKNLNCKLQCCSCSCSCNCNCNGNCKCDKAEHRAPACCLKRLTLHIR